MFGWKPLIIVSHIKRWRQFLMSLPSWGIILEHLMPTGDLLVERCFIYIVDGVVV
jgi:hypothetical protein